MKIIVVLLACAAAASAFDVKPCDELKSEIAAKIEKNGVTNYQLDIVAAGDVKDQTVVGTCEGGAKKITYSKTTSGSSAPVSSDSKPSAAKPSPTAAKNK